MKMYRIYTERKPNIRKIVGRFFDAFTVYDGHGVWRKNREESSIIEIRESDRPIGGMVKRMACALKEANHQAAVLVTCQSVRSILV